MQRRDFLAASAAITTAAALAPHAGAQSAAAAPQYFEWRAYRLKTPEKKALVSAYLEQAALPAWTRMGVKPVGVFTEIGAAGDPTLYVLLVYPTIEKFAAERATLERDPEYQKNAVEYFAAAANDPVLERLNSWLLLSFDGMPQPAVPAKKCTVYELRTYESYNEDRARAKVKMFNDGEIRIFRDCGFQPVFFGEALVGSNLPHLTYMLASPDRAAHDASWAKFREHPDWLAMKDKPEYRDTVSKIVQLYLEPTAYSQL